MSISTIVDVTITKETATVARTGFGTLGILAYFSTTHFIDRASVCGDIDEVEDLGFGSEHLVHKLATAAFAQNPKVDEVVIGRRANAVERKVRLTPAASLPASTAINILLNDDTITYTTDATPTVAEATAGIAAAITAAMPDAWAGATAYVVGDRVKNNGNIYQATAAGTSAASGGPSGTRNDISDGAGALVWKYIGPTVTATDVGPGTSVLVDQDTAGAPFILEVEKRSLLTQKDETVDPGIVADLTAFRTDASGNDTWYGLVTDSQSEAEIAALAASVETLRKLYGAQTADDEVNTSATTDIGSDLATAEYAQTWLLRHEDATSCPAAAFMGRLLPFDPGSETWKFKTLAGVPAMKLTSAETTFLTNKSVNHYQTVGGVNMTAEGVTASGEYIDVTRTIHALTAAIEEDVFGELANALKVAFTPNGIAIIETALTGTLQRFVESGALLEYTVTMPVFEDISSADKAARTLTNVRFTATLAGAIHKVVVNGKLTV